MQFTLGRSKRPDEKFTVEIDFADDMAAGDTIASQTVRAFDVADPDTDLTATLTENLVDSGTVVGCRVKAGTSGKTYAIQFEITTTAGDKFEHDVLLSVSDEA